MKAMQTGTRAPVVRAIAGGVLALAALMLAAPDLAAAGTVGPSAQQRLAQRGGALRADITATFKQLRKDRALRYAAQGGNDVAPLVLKYIPLGTRMDEAAALLNAAGYTLGMTEGHLYARGNLGGDFPNYKPSVLEIRLMPTDRSETATVAGLQAYIVRKQSPGDLK